MMIIGLLSDNLNIFRSACLIEAGYELGDSLRLLYDYKMGKLDRKEGFRLLMTGVTHHAPGKLSLCLSLALYSGFYSSSRRVAKKLHRSVHSTQLAQGL